MTDPVVIGDATLYLGDCLSILPTLGKVDAVVTDPPYGITACEWDTVPNLEKLWGNLKAIGKENCAYVFTASQPFTTDLINSNRKWFRHEWIWNKIHAVGFQVAKYRPMQQHENIIIFCKSGIYYNPQMTNRDKIRKSKLYSSSDVSPLSNIKYSDREYDKYYPKSIITISGADHSDIKHPTQKPVALMEYLIRTYSNESDIILDPFMGSGTTGVAALKLGRKFIGIEIDPTYFKIACDRISKEANQTKLDFTKEKRE